MEIMTPEAGQEIIQFLTRLRTTPGTRDAEILEAQRRYGRFLAPMVREVLQKQPTLWDPALERSLKSLGIPTREWGLARASR
jgi:hypothetical protein